MKRLVNTSTLLLSLCATALFSPGAGADWAPVDGPWNSGPWNAPDWRGQPWDSTGWGNPWSRPYYAPNWNAPYWSNQWNTPYYAPNWGAMPPYAPPGYTAPYTPQNPR
jgi:hypothetical protein